MSISICENNHISKEQVVKKCLFKFYFLLSLTFVPTIMAIIIGLNCNYFFQIVNNIIFMIVSFIVSIAIIFYLNYKKKDNSYLNLSLLMLYGFIVGMYLIPLMNQTLKTPNGIILILFTLLSTFIVFLAMSFLSRFVKNVSFLSSFLFIGLIILICVSLFNIFYHSYFLQSIISGAGVVIFSLYLLLDRRLMMIEIQKCKTVSEFSTIPHVLNIYLDLVNLFISLLAPNK